MTPTNNKLKVQDVEINIRVINEADYISLIPLNSGEFKECEHCSHNSIL